MKAFLQATVDGKEVIRPIDIIQFGDSMLNDPKTECVWRHSDAPDNTQSYYRSRLNSTDNDAVKIRFYDPLLTDNVATSTNRNNANNKLLRQLVDILLKHIDQQE